MIAVYDDAYFMRQALQEAEMAFEKDEVPVGAVIVCKNKIIARAHNQTQMLTDVTAHAEILAITSASSYLNNKYLRECTLYVTLEPCAMCAGAIFWAKIQRVVFAASDDNRGFMKYGKEMLHPDTKVEMGIMMDESSHLLKEFFKKKR
jgi:tRNA(adenine34) deaminase